MTERWREMLRRNLLLSTPQDHTTTHNSPRKASAPVIPTLAMKGVMSVTLSLMTFQDSKVLARREEKAEALITAYHPNPTLCQNRNQIVHPIQAMRAAPRGQHLSL